MTDIPNEKITALQNIILEHANQQRAALATDARKEAEAWLSKEMAKLERETSVVLADAKSRAEDIHRRQILSAEREKSTEALRQQNRLLNEALKRFQDGLVRLRERGDYEKILTALAIESARLLPGAAAMRLKLSAIDAHLGPSVASEATRKLSGPAMAFDPDPAPIIGGCWVASEDGRRQINADWQSRTQEMADTLADRLLSLL
ncbi:MAG: ATPase [Synergistaceae bacterium]|jgi:V/A-type H+-transporting ATPase subunit E|nr:ATPase [Synergistaceae bacterium]